MKLFAEIHFLTKLNSQINSLSWL